MNEKMKMTAIICLTVVICVALMSSCVQNTGFF
jgi:predicted small secreted protein